MSTIPILLYHSISDSASARIAPFTVPLAVFEQHLDLLHERGFQCITVSELIDRQRRGTINPLVPSDRAAGKVALVTFDDGYLDFATTAVPAMRQRKIPSTIYVTTGWMNGGRDESIGRPDDPMMAWSDIADIAGDDVEIGAHSHTHPQMDTLGNATMLDELSRSKALIEDAIGRQVRSFAYPHGYSSRRVRNNVVKTGYDSGAAVRNALSHSTDDPLRLARLMVMADTSIETFQDWIDGKNTPIASSHENLLTTGWRVYRRTKALIGGRPGSDYA